MSERRINWTRVGNFESLEKQARDSLTLSNELLGPQSSLLYSAVAYSPKQGLIFVHGGIAAPTGIAPPVLTSSSSSDHAGSQGTAASSALFNTAVLQGDEDDDELTIAQYMLHSSAELGPTSSRSVFEANGRSLVRTTSAPAGQLRGIPHNGLHVLETSNGRWHNLKDGDGDVYLCHCVNEMDDKKEINVKTEPLELVGGKRRRSPGQSGNSTNVDGVGNEDPLALDEDTSYSSEQRRRTQVKEELRLFPGDDVDAAELGDGGFGDIELLSPAKTVRVKEETKTSFGQQRNTYYSAEPRHSSATHVYLQAYGQVTNFTSTTTTTTATANREPPIIGKETSCRGLCVPIVGSVSPFRHSHVGFLIGTDVFAIHGGKVSSEPGSHCTSELWALHIQSGLWDNLGVLVGGVAPPAMFGHSVLPIPTTGLDANLFCFIGPVGPSEEMAIYLLSTDSGNRHWSRVTLGDSTSQNRPSRSGNGGLRHPNRRYFSIAPAFRSGAIEAELARGRSANVSASSSSSELLLDFFLVGGLVRRCGGGEGGITTYHSTLTWLQDCYFFNSQTNAWTEIIDFRVPRSPFTFEDYSVVSTTNSEPAVETPELDDSVSYFGIQRWKQSSPEVAAIAETIDCRTVFSACTAGRLQKGAFTFYHTPRRGSQGAANGEANVTETNDFLPVDGQLTFMNGKEIVVIAVDEPFYIERDSDALLPQPPGKQKLAAGNDDGSRSELRTSRRATKTQRNTPVTKQEHFLSMLAAASLEHRNQHANSSLTSNPQVVTKIAVPRELCCQALRHQVSRQVLSPGTSVINIGFSAFAGVDHSRDNKRFKIVPTYEDNANGDCQGSMNEINEELTTEEHQNESSLHLMSRVIALTDRRGARKEDVLLTNGIHSVVSLKPPLRPKKTPVVSASVVASPPPASYLASSATFPRIFSTPLPIEAPPMIEATADPDSLAFEFE